MDTDTLDVKAPIFYDTDVISNEIFILRSPGPQQKP